MIFGNKSVGFSFQIVRQIDWVEWLPESLASHLDLPLSSSIQATQYV